VKALFAGLAEVTRRRQAEFAACRANERRQVMALCDAIQVALANRQHDQVALLLKDLRTIVTAALARRRRS
jgi:hypothetical protein